MLGLLGALDPYKHKLNQTGGVLVDGDSAAISKHTTDSEAGNTEIVSTNLSVLLPKLWHQIFNQGLPENLVCLFCFFFLKNPFSDDIYSRHQYK